MGSMEVGRYILLFSLLAAVLASELGRTNAGVSRFEAARSLTEEQSNSQTPRTLVRTERIDPLDGFKKYRSGYNITNKHYWSSTIFTGIHGYSIAVLWLLGGMVYSGVLLVASLCCVRKRKGRHRSQPCNNGHCLWPMPVGVLFTLLAVVTSGVLLISSSRFHSRANSVKRIIQETAQRASNTIYNVTRAVSSMQSDMEPYGNLEGSTRLASTSQKLNKEASRIQMKAEKNVRMITRGLKILQVTTLVIVSLNMVGILLLLGSGCLKLKRPFQLLVVLSWLFTFLCWAYFGLYFFLDRFAGDTCAAFREYRQDPRDSSLGTILPCSDQLSAKLVLRDTRAGIHDLIDQANAKISRLQSSSLPQIAYVCNPFSLPPDYAYSPDNCSSNEIRIGDIPQILRRYTCSGRGAGACGNGEFISASDYSRVLNYTTSVQNLLNSFPGVESLVNCQLVKDALSDVLSTHCSPLKRYAHVTWAAMAALSTAMVLLVLVWVMVARGDSGHQSSNVNPHFSKDTSSTKMGIDGVVEREG